MNLSESVQQNLITALRAAIQEAGLNKYLTEDDQLIELFHVEAVTDRLSIAHIALLRLFVLKP